jgi:hypothetical protein
MGEDNHGQLRQGEASGASEATEVPQTQYGVPIFVNLHEIHPSSQLPGGEFFKEDASDTNYILIHFKNPPSLEEERKLDALTVRVSTCPALGCVEEHRLIVQAVLSQDS